MLQKPLWLACCLLLAIATVTPAQERPKRKRRPNPAFAPIEDVAGLPRVLLLGDSISIGYTVQVRALLESVANVHRARENCGPTSRGIAKLDRWLGDGKWDLIHFNFGLHDLKYVPTASDGSDVVAKSGTRQQVPPEEYERNLQELVERLLATKAKLIWCSTTPVPERSQNRVAGDAAKYNAIAARVMEAHGIPTDDLFALAKPRLKDLQRPANVHFTANGSRVLAEQVAAKIREALKE